MVAGVAYSSFAFKPLWHPPLVRNASFAIQNTIPMESMKTLKFVLFLFTRQKLLVGDVRRRASMLLSAVRKRTPGNQAAPSASAVAIAERTKCDTQCCCKAVGAV